MQIILNNPYRIIGLLVGTKAKDQTRQISRLKQYIEAEAEPQEDFSFPVLGNISRTIDSVNNAESKLNLDKDKMTAALFWFYKGNDIADEAAFDSLKGGNIKEAVSYWAKVTNGKDVDSKTASAFFNLSTLLINAAIKDSIVNEDYLKKGISLRMKFLDSDFVTDLKNLATDATFKVSKVDLQLLFLNQLKTELDKIPTLSSNQLLEIFSNLNFVSKPEFIKRLLNKPFQIIEKRIEDAASKRLLNKANSIVIGKNLYEKTNESLSLLKGILTSSNLQYSSISDKVSDEILQCGIDYFKLYCDTNTDPSIATLELFKIAKSLAIGNIAIQRCQQNTKELTDWINEKPEREKLKRIGDDFEKLKNIIDENDRRAETILNAKTYLVNTKPYLNNIKSVYGSSEDFYLGVSSRIASEALGMCISEINKLQDTLGTNYDQYSKLTTMMLLKQRIDEALDVTTTIGLMDIKNDIKIRLNTNRATLTSLKSQIASMLNPVSRQSAYKSKPASGCYIATMAYGDYNHPQVLILRRFRDDILDKSCVGRSFVKFYYRYSPNFVKVLQNKPSINFIIRKFLNIFINLIQL